MADQSGFAQVPTTDMNWAPPSSANASSGPLPSPTLYDTPASLDYHNTGQLDVTIDGEMETGPANEKILKNVSRSHGGFAGQFLDKRGYGWLLDHEDDEDEEEQLPLLEELDINPADILIKVKAALIPLQ